MRAGRNAYVVTYQRANGATDYNEICADSEREARALFERTKPAGAVFVSIREDNTRLAYNDWKERQR